MTLYPQERRIATAPAHFPPIFLVYASVILTPGGGNGARPGASVPHSKRRPARCALAAGARPSSPETMPMRRLVSLVVLAALGFYVAWPAYSLYRIRGALDAQDAQVLASKVDFDSVRESLKPYATTEMMKGIGKFEQSTGGVLGDCSPVLNRGNRLSN
jgi:hypothetical protein